MPQEGQELVSVLRGLRWRHHAGVLAAERVRFLVETPLAETQLCRQFLRNGACSRGPRRCKWAHTVDLSQSGAARTARCGWTPALRPVTAGALAKADRPFVAFVLYGDRVVWDRDSAERGALWRAFAAHADDPSPSPDSEDPGTPPAEFARRGPAVPLPLDLMAAALTELLPAADVARCARLAPAWAAAWDECGVWRTLFERLWGAEAWPRAELLLSPRALLASVEALRRWGLALRAALAQPSGRTHDGADVAALRLSADGARTLTGTARGELRLWGPAGAAGDKKPLLTLKLSHAVTSADLDATFLLAAGGSNVSAFLVNAPARKHTARVDGGAVCACQIEAGSSALALTEAALHEFELSEARRAECARLVPRRRVALQPAPVRCLSGASGVVGVGTFGRLQTVTGPSGTADWGVPHRWRPPTAGAGVVAGAAPGALRFSGSASPLAVGRAVAHAAKAAPAGGVVLLDSGRRLVTAHGRTLRVWHPTLQLMVASVELPGPVGALACAESGGVVGVAVGRSVWVV